MGSPEGRLYQVEYAMEAIGHAGTCLGILSNEGVVLAAERRNTNKLLDEVFHSEKIYKLNEDMVCSVAGITSDANLLTNELRLIGQRYQYQYGESIPCEQLVSWLCDIKQAYTQSGKEALRRFYPLHGLGQALWLPIVPVRPLWQLWWMEGNLHWQQLECCCVHVETRVQGG